MSDPLDEVRLDLEISLKSDTAYVGHGIVGSFLVLAQIRVLCALLDKLGGTES